jgi:hypothetical protein
MKARILAGALLLTCCGCSTMNNTEKGLLGGGLLGGAVGALAGAALHHPGAGAAIGAAAGAGLGGLAGADADHRERKAEIQATAAAQAAQQVQARALRLDEIVQMTRNGVPDANIIAEIRNRGAVYALTSDDLSYLSQNNVSSPVIMELQAPRRVYAPGPVVYTRPVYVYDPYPPPPPVSLGVGVGVGGYRHW